MKELTQFNRTGTESTQGVSDLILLTSVPIGQPTIELAFTLSLVILKPALFHRVCLRSPGLAC